MRWALVVKSVRYYATLHIRRRLKRALIRIRKALAWLTTNGGGYVAAGVGGGITGKGAHVLVIMIRSKTGKMPKTQITVKQIGIGTRRQHTHD